MERVVSGIRATGKLHLGHLVGALENYLKLQSEYDSFYFIADLHAFTTNFEDPEAIKENRKEVMLDLLSIGLDPEKCTLFIQSRVPEHTYLHLLLSMIVPLPWVERNPTVKEMIRDLKLKENASYGLLGYPILMTTDIILYKASYVPVGKDQLPHLEIAREIVRRFNTLYGKLFIEPEALLTKFPYVPGIDGKKMSKSLKNDIKIADTELETKRKIMSAITDPQKVRLHDKGHPNVCTVFAYQRIFNKEEVEDIRKTCKSGELGCVTCKKRLAEKINIQLRDVRAKREELSNNLNLVNEIFEDGSKKARNIASKTLSEAKTLMKIDGT